MKVWIDQDLCTGDGLCAEIAPPLFQMDENNLAQVAEGGKMLGHRPGVTPTVPADQEEAAVEAAEECPGECIFIEL